MLRRAASGSAGVGTASLPPPTWSETFVVLLWVSLPPATARRRSTTTAPPVQTNCVRRRKRRGWEALFRQRNALLLDLLERFGGLELGGLRRTATVWPSILPSDLDGAVRNATRLVAGGIHSRRTAVAALGGDDPEAEFARVLEEAKGLSAIGYGLSAATANAAEQ